MTSSVNSKSLFQTGFKSAMQTSNGEETSDPKYRNWKTIALLDAS